MALHRLIYASRARVAHEDDIAAILAASERNNATRHITGMLLFSADYFVQLLEGTRSALSDRFVRIAQDTRHEEVVILSFSPIESRLFPEWSMNYIAQYGDPSKVLKRYMSDGSFDPFDMAPNAIEQMCLEFSTIALTAPRMTAAE